MKQGTRHSLDRGDGPFERKEERLIRDFLLFSARGRRMGDRAHHCFWVRSLSTVNALLSTHLTSVVTSPPVANLLSLTRTESDRQRLIIIILCLSFQTAPASPSSIPYEVYFAPPSSSSSPRSSSFVQTDGGTVSCLHFPFLFAARFPFFYLRPANS